MASVSTVVGAEDTKDMAANKANPAADSRYNFGGFLDAGNWYKGNLHLHSTISDGNLDPEATVEVYRKLGYDFTALSDHIGGFLDKEKKEYKPLVYPLDKLNKPGFLVIPAIEYNTTRTGETIHFVVVGPGYDQRLQDGQDLSEAMKGWWDRGAFAFMAHPHWSLDATETLEAMSYCRPWRCSTTQPHGKRAFAGIRNCTGTGCCACGGPSWGLPPTIRTGRAPTPAAAG